MRCSAAAECWASGAKDLAIPLDALKPSADRDALVLNVSEEQIRNAQGFDKDNWPDRPRRSLLQAAPAGQYGYYQPGTHEREVVRETDYGEPGQRSHEGQQWQNQNSEATGFSPMYGAPASAQFVDWPAERDQQWANRVSKIVGTHARDTQNDRIGSIEDLAIDMRDGRIVFAALDPAGKLDVGDRLVAVPWNRLQIEPQQREIVVNANVQALRLAAFDESRWNDLGDPSWARSVFQAYGEQPYWTTYGYQQQFPQQGPQMQGQGQFQRPGERMYNPQTETTIKGRILDVQTMSVGERPMMRILVDDNGQQRVVRLGAQSELPQQLNLQWGEQVQVTGSQVQMDGQSFIIARQVQQNGQTFNLRDSNGRWIFQDQGRRRPDERSDW